MDYQKFSQHLPNLYQDWGKPSVHPKSKQFQVALEKVQANSTASLMQLLNWAVDCMEDDEIYCEIGCSSGANLVGGLLNHPDRIAYAVESISDADQPEEKFERLITNLEQFDLQEQVILCDQQLEEFFLDLRQIQPDSKIGVYFQNNANDYRSVLLSLMLLQPFLADKALIVVANANWSSIQQASTDFLLSCPQAKMLLDLPTQSPDDPNFGNGFQVIGWDINQKISYEWSTISRQNFNQAFIQSLVDANAEYELREKPKAVNKIYEEALVDSYAGRLAEAEEKLEEALRWDNYNAKVWHSLGVIYYQTSRYKEALVANIKSVNIDPSVAVYHYNLGLTFGSLDRHNEAIKAYQVAIRLNSQFVDAYTNLGKAYSLVGNVEKAKLTYQQAITANPENVGSYINLGNILLAQDQVDEAIENYQKALQLRPSTSTKAIIQNNLGSAFKRKEDFTQSAFHFAYAAFHKAKFEEAIQHFKKYLETKTGDEALYTVLALCYDKLNLKKEVIETYQEGLRYYPQSEGLSYRLTVSFRNLGRLPEAIEVANEALSLNPNNVRLKLAKELLLPILYNTQEEIEVYRSKFIQGLEKIMEVVDDEEQLLSISWNNFYLAYQGKNDRELQQKYYGKLLHQSMANRYPEWVKPRLMPPLGENQKIRVGYVSYFMYNHTVGKLFWSWLKHHNKDQYEIYSYYLGTRLQKTTKYFELYSHAFHQTFDLEAMCEQIISDRLHLLVFLDFGMEAQTMQMAALRLAPIQCLAWGHPVTSGLPTIDYFLSSDLMEPENAEEHYSEKLIRLPNLGVAYPKPIVPETPKTRSEFGIQDSAVLYLSCQSLFKYLPQYDYIFPAIAQRVPQAQFAFLRSGESDSITEQFLARLQKAFAQMDLRSEDHCIMLDRMSHHDYLSLNLISDIFLDTFSWSGGNTTLEALACNLPVVTCPGELMRGRHSYGILQMLGVTETIANSETEYIDIAVRLGLDSQWREEVAEKIEANHSRLYNDTTCVKALEEFYQQTVQKHLSS